MASVFCTPLTYVPLHPTESIHVYLNGVEQYEGVDWVLGCLVAGAEATDNFNRANQAIVTGSLTSSGHPYLVRGDNGGSSQATVNNNTLRLTEYASTAISVGGSDGEVEFDLTDEGFLQYWRALLRGGPDYTGVYGVDTCYVVTRDTIAKITYVEPDTYPFDTIISLNETIVTGDHVKATVYGSTIKVWRNGNLIGEVVDTSLTEGDYFGVWHQTGWESSFDNLVVRQGPVNDGTASIQVLEPMDAQPGDLLEIRYAHGGVAGP